MRLISSSGTSCLSLIVIAWLWQRMAPTRTHRLSIGVAAVPKAAPRPRILLVSAPPFHSSSDTPSPMSWSIQGIRLPASGHPAEILHRQRAVGLLREHLPVDLQDRRPRIGEQFPDLGIDETELRQQLAHVLRAASRRRLVGHAGHPLDEIVREEAVHPHQHAADRAVAADVVPDALRQRALDDGHVHRDRGRSPHRRSYAASWPRRSSSRSSLQRAASGRSRDV